MTKPVILLGRGGHAKVIVDALRLSGAQILGVTDKNFKQVNSTFCALPILGDDQCILQYSPTDIELVNGIGSLPNHTLRADLFHAFSDRGYRFQTVIHPSAVIADSVELKQGVQVMAGAIVQADTMVDENSIINTRASIDHDCQIGRNVHIAPGAVLSGGVRLSEKVHIGTGASLIQGITIGSNAVVGAGAIVGNDILSNQIVYPARSAVKTV